MKKNIPFKSKDLAKKNIKEIPFPENAIPRIKELLQQVDLFQKLQGAPLELRSTMNGIGMALGLKNGKVNFQKMCFEVEDKEEVK